MLDKNEVRLSLFLGSTLLFLAAALRNSSSGLSGLVKADGDGADATRCMSVGSSSDPTPTLAMGVLGLDESVSSPDRTLAVPKLPTLAKLASSNDTTCMSCSDRPDPVFCLLERVTLPCEGADGRKGAWGSGVRGRGEAVGVLVEEEEEEEDDGGSAGVGVEERGGEVTGGGASWSSWSWVVAGGGGSWLCS